MNLDSIKDDIRRVANALEYEAEGELESTARFLRLVAKHMREIADNLRHADPREYMPVKEAAE